MQIDNIVYRFVVLLLCLQVHHSPQAQSIELASQQLAEAVSAQQLRALVEQLVAFGTRHTLSDTLSDSRGIGAAQRWALRTLSSYSPRLRVYMDPFEVEADGRRIPYKARLYNVVAVLPGSDPHEKRLILLTAHIDSRASDVMDSQTDAPGANDNASGTALVMEAARVLSQYRFPCTIMFVLFTGEEQGLYGARYMAQQAKEKGWNIIAVLNNDIVGNSHSAELGISDNTHVRIFSEGVSSTLDDIQLRRWRALGYDNDGPSRQLARYMANIAQQYVHNLEAVLIYRRDRFLRGGDHTPFNEAGFAAIRVCEYYEDYNHQHQDIRTEGGIRYGDLPEFMDFEYLRKNTVLNVLTAAHLAWAPDVPTQVGMLAQRLTHITELHWQPPSQGPRPAGYYVLIRPSSAAQWQQAFYTTQTRISLPYSKDNYLFAVQACSSEGYRSLAAIPMP